MLVRDPQDQEVQILGLIHELDALSAKTRILLGTRCA